MESEEIIKAIKEFEERENMTEEQKVRFELGIVILSVIYGDRPKEDSLQ